MPSGPDEHTDSVATAMAALKKAADALSETAAAQRPASDSVPQPSASDSRGTDEASQRYYQHLRQRGALVDVDDATDLGQLPPEVTHVQFPDGRIRRLGYS
jgi:hypothetical protein